MTEEQKDIQELFFQQLEMHILDMNGNVRSKVLNLWTKMQVENAIPIDRISDILHKASRRLTDKVATVRKNAMILLTKFVQTNPFSPVVIQLHYPLSCVF